ncbi:Cytochrome oxidase complex assembly protein 1 [Photorhabdus australis subsp. thailandensis]|uniref:Cytochrome oxidase complex assembly protein 1 n=1 Tax=Photorhabdus australis subsp. thailandensis TaxID=2805096 RepID=A0A1C0U883_9GAMM|nr:cytochrome c oxidase assembly factor Coa1 family protein [Photorhabdus australis]OCQ54144.1 Cytochrome oxidase complex assembly protein 1 [Photorhabdus australis subsp. thailandensis]
MKIKEEWNLSNNETMTDTSLLLEKRSWVAGKWKWLILCLVPLFIVGVFTFVMGTMKSSEPYEKALSLAQSNSVVKSILGQPIEAGWFISGSISNSDAELEIPIKGNKSSGTIYVEAEKHSGHWQYKTMTVQPDTEGGLINLLNPNVKK